MDEIGTTTRSRQIFEVHAMPAPLPTDQFRSDLTADRNKFRTGVESNEECGKQSPRFPPEKEQLQHVSMPDQTKILIVEDDTLIADLYTRYFRSKNADVIVHNDGERAIEYLREDVPDVALLDLMLPKVNGLDILKFIRADDRLKDVPCIVLTNAYLGNMVQSAWQAGANRCLTKVFSKPPQVFEMLQSLLAEQKSETSSVVEAESSGETVPSEADDSEREFQVEFQAQTPRILASIRQSLAAVVKTEMDEAYLKWLEERSMLLQSMYQQLHELCGKAGAAGYEQAAQLASALEAMLQELADIPQNMSASVLRTFAAGVDFLALELSESPKPANHRQTTPVALVVDDEAFSRRAVIAGLEKVGLANVSMNNPREALELLRDRTFDLIFLDVDMPDLSGFDTCVELRKMPQHQQTPVIFVTGVSDFNARAKSSLSGGNDLIAKPFLPIELAVKALTQLYRERPPTG